MSPCRWLHDHKHDYLQNGWVWPEGVGLPCMCYAKQEKEPFLFFQGIVPSTGVVIPSVPAELMSGKIGYKPGFTPIAHLTPAYRHAGSPPLGTWQARMVHRSACEGDP